MQIDDLVNRIRYDDLTLAELRRCKPDQLTALVVCSGTQTTTAFHQLMVLGSEMQIRAVLEILGASNTQHYMVRDSDQSTPLHCFAQRPLFSDAFSKFVIEQVPLAALRAVDSTNDTAAHLFALCGNQYAVQLCKERDSCLATATNGHLQTPTELMLQRAYSDTRSQLNSADAENRRLTHNLSKADDDEAKLADFYTRIDAKMKQHEEEKSKMLADIRQRDDEKQRLQLAFDQASKRVEAAESGRAKQEQIMREAIESRTSAQRQASALAAKLKTFTENQSAASDAERVQKEELAHREAELAERTTSLEQAYAEIEQMRVEVDTTKRAELDAAERKAAELATAVERERATNQATTMTLEEHTRRAADLERQIANLKHTQDDVARLRTEIDADAKAKIAEAERRADELESEVARQTEERDSAASKLAQQRADYARLEEQLEELRATEQRQQFELRRTSLKETEARDEFAQLQLRMVVEERKQSAEREMLLQQIDSLKQAHQRAESQVARLSTTSAEAAQQLQTALDAERQRNVALAKKHDDYERTLKTMRAELEAERTRPSSPRTARRGEEEQSTSATALPAAVAVAIDNSEFIANVFARLNEGDVATMTLLLSDRLALNPNNVNLFGHSLLEVFFNTTVQNYLKLKTAAGADKGKLLGGEVEQQFTSAHEMFELLVRAGARWDGMQSFIDYHLQHFSAAMLEKVQCYESFSPFIEALLVGEQQQQRDVLQRLTSTVRYMGNPNHVLTQFVNKAQREQYVSRGLSLLHMAIELYAEHVEPVVALLLRQPDIDVNKLDARGATPLHTAINRHCASKERCVALVEMLLARGANPEITCADADLVGHWREVAEKRPSKLKPAKIRPNAPVLSGGSGASTPRAIITATEMAHATGYDRLAQLVNSCFSTTSPRLSARRDIVSLSSLSLRDTTVNGGGSAKMTPEQRMFTPRSRSLTRSPPPQRPLVPPLLPPQPPLTADNKSEEDNDAGGGGGEDGDDDGDDDGSLSSNGRRHHRRRRHHHKKQ